MKSKLFACVVLGVLAARLSGAEPAAAEARKMPVIATDLTPIGEAGNLPAVSSYADMLEPVQRTVVTIEAKKNVPPELARLLGRSANLPPRDAGLGSGVVISADGYILTNNHVVEEADVLEVTLADSRQMKAIVIGKDPKTDLAIVKIDATGLPAITFADSDKLRVGDVVFAIGNPLGVGQTVTMGIVSAKGRNIHLLEDVNGYEDFIQTDAAINMGNSGGALVDARGRLVGINGAILAGNTGGSIGIGFAVPVRLALSIMTSLIEKGTVTRGHLGIDVDPISPDLATSLGLDRDVRGVIVVKVWPETPAEKVGLKLSDVLLNIDGHVVTTENELKLLVSQRNPGTTGDLKIIRAGKEQTIRVTFDEQSGRASNEILAGITVAPLSDELRTTHKIAKGVMKGLVVTSVAPDSEFFGKFEVPNVITQINGSDVSEIAEAKTALSESRPSPAAAGKKIASFLVANKGFVTVTFSSP